MKQWCPLYVFLYSFIKMMGKIARHLWHKHMIIKKLDIGFIHGDEQ